MWHTMVKQLGGEAICACKIDCTVTGSNEGAMDDPKCPVFPIFGGTTFKKVGKKRAPDKKCRSCMMLDPIKIQLF